MVPIAQHEVEKGINMVGLNCGDHNLAAPATVCNLEYAYATGKLGRCVFCKIAKPGDRPYKY